MRKNKNKSDIYHHGVKPEGWLTDGGATIIPNFLINLIIIHFYCKYNQIKSNNIILNSILIFKIFISFSVHKILLLVVSFLFQISMPFSTNVKGDREFPFFAFFILCYHVTVSSMVFICIMCMNVNVFALIVAKNSYKIFAFIKIINKTFQKVFK